MSDPTERASWADEATVLSACDEISLTALELATKPLDVQVQQRVVTLLQSASTADAMESARRVVGGAA